MNTTSTIWKFAGFVLLAGSLAACNGKGPGPGEGQGSDMLKSTELQKSLELARQAFPTTSEVRSEASELMYRLKGQTLELSKVTIESSRNGVVFESSSKLASEVINSCISRPTQEICGAPRAFQVLDQDTARGTLLNQESVDLYFGFEADATNQLMLVNIIKLVPNNLSVVESGAISLVADDLTISSSESLASGIVRRTTNIYKRRR